MQNIAVIGLGRFGTALAYRLRERDVSVQAIDIKESEVHDVRDRMAQALQFDARDKRLLEAHGVHEMDKVVVAIGENFEAAQECVIALKDLGAPHIIARGQTIDRRRILEMIGADRVVSPEEESAKRVAGSLTHPLVSEAHDLGSGIEVATMKVPKAFAGKTLMELRDDISAAGIVVVRITRSEPAPGQERVVMPPGAHTVLEAGDQMTVVAKSSDINDLATS